MKGEGEMRRILFPILALVLALGLMLPAAVVMAAIDVPTNFSVTVNADNSVTGSWDQLSNVDKYDMQYANDAGFNPYNTVTVNHPTTSATTPVLTDDTWYFRVRGKTTGQHAEQGGWCSPVSVEISSGGGGNPDETPPLITINVPEDEATYILNEPVIADWDVTDEDSGVNWGATYGTVPSGDPIDTSTVGTHEFYVYAEDNAGNPAEKTVTYDVVYNFGGFLPPLVINGVGNGLFKAGSTIPVKFQLTNYDGNPVGTATGTASIDTSPVASAAIRYDATAMQYIANLKTPKGVTGDYTITVNLDDGSTPTISVTLK
jgi:hypothetical protein